LKAREGYKITVSAMFGSPKIKSDKHPKITLSASKATTHAAAVLGVA
jgi:hypothetical protein